MRRAWHISLCALLFAAILPAAALFAAGDPLVVVVNPESGITRMDREEVARIFLGTQKRLPSGLVVLPVEALAPEPARALFYQELVGMALPQMRSYWAKVYFSGQAQPPRHVRSYEEVLQTVAANKGAVGFLQQSSLDRRVRPVLVLGSPDPR